MIKSLRALLDDTPEDSKAPSSSDYELPFGYQHPLPSLPSPSSTPDEKLHLLPPFQQHFKSYLPTQWQPTFPEPKDDHYAPINVLKREGEDRKRKRT
ncbi:hypothetical protein PQX77_020190, partial [Marasmius sp. AFHP31]